MTSRLHRQIERTSAASLFVGEAGETETCFVASVDSAAVEPKRAAADIYSRIAAILARRGLKIVQERVFGSLRSRSAVVAARAEALRAGRIPPEGPITYVQGRPLWGEGLAGVVLRAAAGSALDDYEIIADRGTPCGRMWRSGGLRFIALQNRNGLSEGHGPAEPAPLQVRRLIEGADRLLREHGSSYRDAARTWFYLRDILAWYDRFNEVRNECYRRFGLMPGPADGRLLLPASTGVGGESAGGAAVVMDLLAVAAPPQAPPCVSQLSNDRQPRRLLLRVGLFPRGLHPPGGLHHAPRLRHGRYRRAWAKSAPGGLRASDSTPRLTRSRPCWPRSGRACTISARRRSSSSAPQTPRCCGPPYPAAASKSSPPSASAPTYAATTSSSKSTER